MSIFYLEDNFITKDQSEDLIKFYKKHLHVVTRYNATYPLPLFNNYKNEYILKTVVDRMVNICENLIDNIELNNLEIVRRPIKSSMDYHVDDSITRDSEESDVLAGILYLNDDYLGGSTGFESFQIEPKVGRLIVFSNSYYRHCVNEVKDNDRYTLSSWFVEKKKLDKETV